MACNCVKQRDLPKLTPPEIIKWVEGVELYFIADNLRSLPENATLELIKETYYSEKFVLRGIGEELANAASIDYLDEY